MLTLLSSFESVTASVGTLICSTNSSSESLSGASSPKQLAAEETVERWEEYWTNGGKEYEQGEPSVALKELLEVHGWLLPRGRCLIAGCGRGHDVLYMAQRGYKSTGIDVSSTAITEAQKLLEATKDSELIEKADFAAQDFFTFKPDVRFTTAFEYGLFSAIHPSQRQLWAETYARLIAPQGSLIVLLYPMIQRGQSPPFRVTMAECESVLKRHFMLVRVDSNFFLRILLLFRLVAMVRNIVLNDPNTKVDPTEYSQMWHKAWDSNNIPWDAGEISPALRELIEEKHWELPSGQGIVPGCGSGYDAMFLASPSLRMVGADLSPLAVEAAAKIRDQRGIPSDLVDFKVIDFFDFDVPADKYQVAYDYTFFCAIHPSMREAWGKRYAEIMAPGAHLIVLMFPLDKPEEDRNRGPPFMALEEHYHQALDANFDLIHIDPKCKTHESRAGMEVITVWRRK
ncbi:hypothetical protein GGI12_000200 [Dipsacomyces acuminosporus]|nr:hypothetical protein GGI12_000200 [Dipsacomyces acuminosporus]